MIADIITLLQANDYCGGGDCIEIAKGKHEYTTSWKGFKRKTARAWQSQKQ